MKKMILVLSLLVLTALILTGCSTGEAVKFPRGRQIPTVSPSANVCSFACDVVEMMQEGGITRYSPIVGPGKYIKLPTVRLSDADVSVDGIPASIPLGGMAVVNGLSVRVINILYQSYAGGVHQATLCLG